MNTNEKSLLSRVEDEMAKYPSSNHAVLDHLNMAHAHLFEETEGRDIDSLLSDIEKIIQKIENKTKNLKK